VRASTHPSKAGRRERAVWPLSSNETPVAAPPSSFGRMHRTNQPGRGGSGQRSRIDRGASGMISIEGHAGTICRLSGLSFALGSAMRRGWPVNVPRKTRISLLQQPAGCPCGGPGTVLGVGAAKSGGDGNALTK
jgi:hypothetical protein